MLGCCTGPRAPQELSARPSPQPFSLSPMGLNNYQGSFKGFLLKGSYKRVLLHGGLNNDQYYFGGSKKIVIA